MRASTRASSGRQRNGPAAFTIAPSMPTPARSFFLISLLAVALAAASAGAAVTKSFRQTSAKDFEEGEATASMILPDGAVVPGMKPSPIALDAAFVWCSTLSPDGQTAYFGTGDEGRIFAVDVGNNEARARRVAALDAAWITALGTRPDGTLVAGTTPGGRLYTVDPKSGSSRLFATLGVDHVWALAIDAKTGAVYAGTGGPGKIFAIDPSGKSREVWNSGDKHVVSLIQADATHLYAGTSEEAILFRVGLDGRAEALADFDAEEVRALGRFGAPSTPRSTTSSAPARRRSSRRPAPTARESPSRRRDRRPRPARCRARASARRRRRCIGSIPTATSSRSSRRATATSLRWRSTTTAGPSSAAGPRGAFTASIRIARPPWRSLCRNGRR